MGLEAATYISQLVPTNPVGATDPVSQGDDHIRLLKTTLQNTFAAITGAVTATHTELNQLHGGPILLSSAGTAGAPAYSFAGDSNTGLYSGGADRIDVATGGVSRLSISTTFFDINVGPLRIPDGSAAAPSFTFFNDPDSGVYRRTSNSVSIAAGGVFAFEVQQNASYAPDGTVSLPALSFFNDPDCGLYRNAANDIRIGVAGAVGMAFLSTAIISVPQFQVSDGSVSAPGLAFSSDTNTGLWRAGGDTLSIVAGGASVATFANGTISLGNALGYILDLGAVGISSSATGGGATALPSQPAGYASIALTGTIKKFPYYNL